MIYHRVMRPNMLNRHHGGGSGGVVQSMIVGGLDKYCFAATTTTNTTYSSFPPSSDSNRRSISTTSTGVHPVYGAHSPHCSCCQFSSSINHQPHWTHQPSPQHEAKYIRHMSNDSKSEDQEESGILNSNSSHDVGSTSNGDSALSGLPGSQTGGKKLAIIFTCTVCNTRAAKQFTEQAYLHGVVLVKCPGCQNQHLIADNLSMFTDDTDNDDGGGGWNIQKAMAKLGQNVTTVTDGNVLELTLDQVIGAEKLKETIGEGSSNSISNSNSTNEESNTTNTAEDTSKR